MKKQQEDKILKQYFIGMVKPEFAQGVAWLLRWDMVPITRIKAFICRKLYCEALAQTKAETGLKYGDKKQAIAKVQEVVPLSQRQIENILKK